MFIHPVFSLVPTNPGFGVERQTPTPWRFLFLFGRLGVLPETAPIRLQVQYSPTPSFPSAGIPNANTKRKAMPLNCCRPTWFQGSSPFLSVKYYLVVSLRLLSNRGSRWLRTVPPTSSPRGTVRCGSLAGKAVCGTRAAADPAASLRGGGRGLCNRIRTRAFGVAAPH